MKLGKRICSIVLVIALVLTMLPATALAADPSTVTFTGYTAGAGYAVYDAAGQPVTVDVGAGTAAATQGSTLTIMPTGGRLIASVAVTPQGGDTVTYFPNGGPACVISVPLSDTATVAVSLVTLPKVDPNVALSVEVNGVTNVTAFAEGDVVRVVATVPEANPGDVVLFIMPDGTTVNGYIDAGRTAVATWTVPSTFTNNGATITNASIQAKYLGNSTTAAKSVTADNLTANTRTLSNAGASIQVTPADGGNAVDYADIETQTGYTLTVAGVSDMQGVLLTENTSYTVAWYKSTNDGVTWSPIADVTNVLFDSTDTMYKAEVSPAGAYQFGAFELVVGAGKVKTVFINDLTVAPAGALYEGQEAVLTATVNVASSGTVKFYENDTLIGEANLTAGRAELRLTDALLGRTLTAGTNTYTAAYSGVEGVYSTASRTTDPIAVYSGTLPGDWAITKENNGNPVQPPARPNPNELENNDIGVEIMLTVEPTGVLNPQLTPADYTVDWFMSTDNGASYSLIAQAAGNTIAVRPLNNQYRYYAVIKPSDGGNYYRPINGISVTPIIFGNAWNNTYVNMTTATPLPFENTKMAINVAVWDTLNTDDLNDDIPVKGGTVTLSVQEGPNGTPVAIETLPVDGSGMASFLVDVPSAGVYIYSANYTHHNNAANKVYGASGTSAFTFQDKVATAITVRTADGTADVPVTDTTIDGTNYIYARSNELVWYPLGGGAFENTIAITDEETGNPVVDGMTSGREYTLTAPDVYTEFTYYENTAESPYQMIKTGYVKLVENVDFYYEWQISTDSGNTWTTKGNRDKSLTDVIADDDVVYKVRVIPTGSFAEPTGGLDSATTDKAARIDSEVIVTVSTTLSEGADNMADAYEATPVTIRAELNPDYERNFDDLIDSPYGYIAFEYAVWDDTMLDADPTGFDWQPVVPDDGTDTNKVALVSVQDLIYATITTSTLPVSTDGTMQRIVFRATYYGDNAYAVADNFIDADDPYLVSPELFVWSSVPYVNLSTENLVDETPTGIVVTAAEASFAENGEAAGVLVDENGNVTIEGAGPDDLGNLYGDGSYQALTLTTPLLTRDGYENTDPARAGMLAQVGDTDIRIPADEVPEFAVLDADFHYDIYWEYCPNYKAELVNTNADGVIGGAIDSADGDANNWLAVEGSANWHTILVAPEFASYAFRAKIVLRDTDATKAAFNGIEAVPERETPDMTASGVLYGEETMKSAARPTYYSNVILVNAGANAANNGLEAVVSPSSSGAKGGDTVIVDAFAYGGSTSATPTGFVELYVDRFEADEWVTLDALEGGAYTVSDRDDDYRQALVNGEAVWNLQNMQPGVYSFKLVYENADGTYASEKYIYNYIVRDDTYGIALKPVEEIYDGERHAPAIVVSDYDEDGGNLAEKDLGEWVWNYYEYAEDNTDECIDLVQLIYDNIAYYYYALGGDGYAETPSVTAPVDHGDYKVDAVLLDTLALTRRSATLDGAIKVLKRAVYLEDVTYQTEIYDPTNLAARKVNVLYTELNQAPVTSKVGDADTGFYSYGTNGTLPSAEADVTYTTNSSDPGTGLPARSGANAIGVVAGDTVFARAQSANVAAGQYKAGADRTVSIVVSLDGADADNYYLVQSGTTAGAMTDDRTETYTNFPITITRNQVYAGWTGTTAASFQAVEESGTTAPDMDVEVYYHGEGKIALSATGTWTKASGFSAFKETDQWDDENGATIVPADMTKAGLYTVVVRPQDTVNYKGGASTKVVVTVDGRGNITRTYTKTMDSLAAPTLFDVTGVQHIYDGTNKEVAVILTNPAYTAADVTYYFDGAETTDTATMGRYGVTAQVADKNGVTLDSPYSAAGIMTVYRGEKTYDAPIVADKTYDGAPVEIVNKDAYPDGTYFTFSGGRIKGVSYDAPADAGRYVVTAHIPNTHDYAETTVTVAFEIAKKLVTAQVMNTYHERFTTIAKADVRWDGLVDGDSTFSDVLILPSFAPATRYPTHVGSYDVKAVEASFGREVDADRAAFADELLDYTAYAYNYVIDTVDGTNSVIANGERVDFEILGLAGHGTVHYGDVIDLWTTGNTADYWSGGAAKGVSESSIIRWDVVPAEGFTGTVLVDALTGLLYVAGVGEFTVYAFRGTGNDVVYTTKTVRAEKYEVDIVVDQEDYIYDGTAKLLSQETDRVHIGFLDEMTVTLTQMTELAKVNPNPELYQKKVTLFNARDVYIYNYSMTKEAINKLIEGGLITQAEKAEYLEKYSAEPWVNVGDYMVAVYINPFGSFYTGSGSNRLTIHESYKDVAPDMVEIDYGTGYQMSEQGDDYYEHVVDSTLNALSGLAASNAEVLTLDDAWVFGNVNRRADAGAYTSFVAGGTESNGAQAQDSNFIYNYHNGEIRVTELKTDYDILNTGFSRQDGTGFTDALNRVYGDDTYVLDYAYTVGTVTDGDSLADFMLNPDFMYATVGDPATQSGEKLYTRELPVRGDVVLDRTDYKGVGGIILSNPAHHAERDDGDIYTVEASHHYHNYESVLASNHYGEQIKIYITDLYAKNTGAKNYPEYDDTLYDGASYEGYVTFTTRELKVSQRPVALTATPASIPYGAAYEDAYALLVSCFEMDGSVAANAGLAYEHEVADLELRLYTMIDGRKQYLTEDFLDAWYEDANVDKAYTFSVEIGNTNYHLLNADDATIDVDITKTQIWGRVTWLAGRYNASRYTDNFTVTFYKSVYNDATGKWDETNERVVLNDKTVAYTIRKYAADGKGEILVEGTLVNPGSTSYTYSSGTYDKIYEQVQVFFQANGYKLISVR